jgi:hypothetical protein
MFTSFCVLRIEGDVKLYAGLNEPSELQDQLMRSKVIELLK